MADPMEDIFSDNDEDVENEEMLEDAAQGFLPVQRSNSPAPALGMNLTLRNPLLEALLSEERRSRSRSPSQDRVQAPSVSRNEYRAATPVSNSPSRRAADGNGFGGRTRNRVYDNSAPTENNASWNRVAPLVERSESQKDLLGDRIIKNVTKYPFKLYFIIGLVSVCLYAVFHLHTTTHELQADVTQTMINFQAEIKSEFSKEFRKHELRYTSEMENLKAELATMTSEVSKLMKRITIKQIESENSAENVQESEWENYYSQILKYVRMQPEDSKGQEQLSPVAEMERINIFRELLRKQRVSFRSQPRQTWTELYSSVVSTFSPSSTRPAAIVLLIPPQLQYTQFPSCFARRLGNDINHAFHGQHKIGLKEMSPIGLSEASSLTKIHEDLNKYFDAEGGRAVLVHNLEKIQAYEILMVFQAYCDNVEAYEKQATFIFTLNVSERIYEDVKWTQENRYRIAHDSLHEAWANVLPVDKRSPLISRVVVNSILLEEGDSCL